MTSQASSGIRLSVIDGTNTLRRLFHANPAPDTIEKGQKVMQNALTSFRRILHSQQPTHAVAPFDFGGHTWRHDLYPEYHGQRAPAPQLFLDILEPFKEKLLKELGLAHLSVPGVEADDVIGLLCTQVIAAKPDATVYATSTDKDIAHLTNFGVQVVSYFDNELRDALWIFDKFLVDATLLLDSLALQGDKTDGVLGVPSCGVKTAAKWLNAYGNLQGVLENAEHIKGAAGEKLRANIEQVKLARKLVSFKLDFSLNLSLKDLKYSGPL